MTMGISPTSAPASIPPTPTPAPPADTCPAPPSASDKTDGPAVAKDGDGTAGGGRASRMVLGEPIGYGGSSSTNGGTRGR